ncbi:MAG: aminotransferase class V-fold PLP-dependent enzyme [Verrucomicrobiota bacterium]
MKSTIYLDQVSMTRPHPEILAAMSEVDEAFPLNPNASHRYGRQARKIISDSRGSVSDWLKVPEESLAFCADAEQSMLAMIYSILAKRPKGKIVSSAIEHPALMNLLTDLEQAGYEVCRMGCDAYGFLDPAAYSEEITEEAVMVILHLANHDSGAVQPVQKIVESAREKRVPVLCDAGYGGLELNRSSLEDLGVDWLFLSPQRLFGPSGTGIIYEKNPSHADGSRGWLGNPSLRSIAGAGKMAALHRESGLQWQKQLTEESQFLFETLETKVKGVHLIGPEVGGSRYPIHLSIALDGLDGETLMLKCDLMKLAIMAKAGCLPPDAKRSPVFREMGVHESLGLGTVLLGVGLDSSHKILLDAIERFAGAVDHLRTFSPG